MLKNYIAVHKLSNREIECLMWKIKGKSAKEIAKILNISYFTVETHAKNIRKKLNCSTIIEAVISAIRNGDITLETKIL